MLKYRRPSRFQRHACRQNGDGRRSNEKNVWLSKKNEIRRGQKPEIRKKNPLRRNCNLIF